MTHAKDFKKLLFASVSTLFLLTSRSASAQFLPSLTGPFTLEFESSASDPRSEAVFKRDEAAFKKDLAQDVKVGGLTQTAVDQILAQRLAAYRALRKGVRSGLTISSNGDWLVSLRKKGPEPDAEIDQALIAKKDRLYVANIPGGTIPPSLKVTVPSSYSAHQSMPFLGATLPNLPPLIEPADASKDATATGKVDVKLMLPPVDAKSKPRPINAVAVFDGSPTPTLQSVTVGTPPNSTVRWELSDYSSESGVMLPKTVRLVTSESPTIGHPTHVLVFRLKQFRKEPLEGDPDRAEKYIAEKSIVKDDFPERSPKGLVYEFKKDGGTVEEQSRKHDTLEAGISQREERGQTTPTSYAGIFGIVGIVVVGTGLYLVSQRAKNAR